MEKNRMLEDLSKEELKEKFELFLFNMDDCLEQFEEKTTKQGYNFDYSLDSLPLIEKYIVNNNVDDVGDDYDYICSYVGEVVRKNFKGSKWICNLDDVNNSLYFGFPVITGLCKVEGVLFSPFHVIKAFILRKKPNFLCDAIENQVNP